MYCQTNLKIMYCQTKCVVLLFTVIKMVYVFDILQHNRTRVAYNANTISDEEL